MPGEAIAGAPAIGTTMDDFGSLSLPDLRARLCDCATRRLDADSDLGRDRAGAELLALLDELEARGVRVRTRAAVAHLDLAPLPLPGTRGRSQRVEQHAPGNLAQVWSAEN